MYLRFTPTTDLVALLRSMRADLAGLKISRPDYDRARRPIVDEIQRREMKRAA